MKLEQKKSSVTRGHRLESILIKETRIFLSFETQVSKKRRPFRLSSTRKCLEVPERWVDKVLKNHWIHSFIYLDEDGGSFEVQIGYYDEFISLKKFNKNGKFEK